MHPPGPEALPPRALAKHFVNTCESKSTGLGRLANTSGGISRTRSWGTSALQLGKSSQCFGYQICSCQLQSGPGHLSLFHAIACCLASLPLFVVCPCGISRTEFCESAALAQEFKPLPSGKLVGSLDKFISSNAAHSLGSVEQHHGDQTKCLPSSFFANCVSHQLCSTSFLQSDEEPMAKSSPQEMEATLQHGSTSQELDFKINVIHLCPTSRGHVRWDAHS